LRYTILGQTGIKVSYLCFGCLTISPLQRNLPINKGVDLLVYAFDMGINFYDTAELYKTNEYLKEFIKLRPRQDIVIATKSYAYDARGAQQSLEKALREMGTDYIDIFLMHEQESDLTIKGHYEALEYYLKARDKGFIRAVGLSTHNIRAVTASIKYEGIQVIHPIINYKGVGIEDGGIDDMLEAVSNAYSAGKGIYAMKPLGGGTLIKDRQACFDFVLGLKNIHSIAVGMQTREEVSANIAVFNGRKIPDDIYNKLGQYRRKLHIDDWCEGCGNCKDHCGQKALKIIHGKARVDEKKCILCGYCGAKCPLFCIKII